MRYYGVSQVGQYHLDSGSDVCQDAFAIEVIDDDTVVAAVADGVGSEDHSEIASETAVKSCVTYCKEFYNKIEDKFVLLSNSFQEALFSIQDKSRELEIQMDQLDCTLCAIILTKDCVFCGNVGDSGAIGLSKKGDYILLTEQQNDESGAVYPLASQPSWQFYQLKEEFVSVILATDGFYNYLFPRYMAVDTENRNFRQQKILDYETASKFLDPPIENCENGCQLQEAMEQLVNGIPREGGWDGIIDDLTVVGLITGKQHENNDLYSRRIDREKLKQESSEITNEILYGKTKETVEEDANPDFVEQESSELLSDLSSFDFNTSALDLTEAKIEMLIRQRPPKSIFNRIEWPIQIIRNGMGQYHDCIKSHIGSHVMISDFMNDEDNRQWINRRANVAFNLASIMMECHRNNIVAGITSERNIAVGERREVYLVNLDIDQIDILNTGREIPLTSLCSLDPGFEMKDECEIMTVTQMEDGLLSLLIFKLLFNNSSPFRKDGDQWTYVGDSDPSIPDVSLFPAYITDLFDRAFKNNDINTMPASSEWYDALNRYSDEVIRCTRHEGHVYYRDASVCPYCECNEITNPMNDAAKSPSESNAQTTVISGKLSFDSELH